MLGFGRRRCQSGIKAGIAIHTVLSEIGYIDSAFGSDEIAGPWLRTISIEERPRYSPLGYLISIPVLRRLSQSVEVPEGHV